MGGPFYAYEVSFWHAVRTQLCRGETFQITVFLPVAGITFNLCPRSQSQITNLDLADRRGLIEVCYSWKISDNGRIELKFDQHIMNKNTKYVFGGFP